MPRVARVSDIKANLLRPATTSHFEVEIPIIANNNFSLAMVVQLSPLFMLELRNLFILSFIRSNYKYPEKICQQN